MEAGGERERVSEEGREEEVRGKERMSILNLCRLCSLGQLTCPVHLDCTFSFLPEGSSQLQLLVGPVPLIINK